MPRPRKDVVEYRVYDLPTALPILCLSGEEWRISDTLSQRLHFHNCMEIGICHSDSGVLQYNDTTVPFKAGDVFFIPRYVPHTTCSDKGCRSLWSYLFVDLDVLGKSLRAPMLVQGSMRAPCYQISKDSQPRLHFLANCMLEECLRRREDTADMLRVYGLALRGEMQRLEVDDNRAGAQKTDRGFALRPALEYISTHYMDECDAQTLSDICHLSQTHFRRLFLSVMHVSPLKFITNARINRACVLLNTTDDPVISIAQNVGISSISSFNRNFQQLMGVSPRAYRRRAQTQEAARTRIMRYQGWEKAEERPEHAQDDE